VKEMSVIKSVVGESGFERPRKGPRVFTNIPSSITKEVLRPTDSKTCFSMFRPSIFINLSSTNPGTIRR
jgi:hypothetical protein